MMNKVARSINYSILNRYKLAAQCGTVIFLPAFEPVAYMFILCTKIDPASRILTQTLCPHKSEKTVSLHDLCFLTGSTYATIVRR